MGEEVGRGLEGSDLIWGCARLDLGPGGVAAGPAQLDLGEGVGGVVQLGGLEAGGGVRSGLSCFSRA